MNKPTREQIEHRAIELLLNFDDIDYCNFCRLEKNCTGIEEKCTSELVKTALEKAKEELSFLTKKQRETLKKKIELLQQATGNKYNAICFDDNLDCGLPQTELFLSENENVFDVISGNFVSFADEVFEPNEIYMLEDIL